MSIRCAQCGSTRVAIDTNKEGFSVGKAIAGTALFGAGGAVMGINGKEKQYYHCGACGAVLSYCMSNLESNEIDLLLLDPENNEFLLSSKKQKYPNIEWSDNRTNAAVTMPSSGSNAYAVEEERYAALKKMGETIYSDNSTLFRDMVKSIVDATTSPTPPAEIRSTLYKKVMETGLTDNGVTANAIVEQMMKGSRVLWIKDENGLLRGGTPKEVLKQADKEHEQRRQENQAFRNIIMPLFKDGEKLSISKILDITKTDYSYQRVSVILKEMVEEKILASEVEKKITYYFRPKAVKKKINAERNEARRRIKGIEIHNAQIREKIKNLEKEKAQVEAIYEKNKKKIFGKGAKLKKQSKQRISELESEITWAKRSINPIY